MARRTKAARRRRVADGGEAWKIVLGVLAGVIALGGFGGLLYFQQTSEKPIARDASTLCPLSGPQSIQVILLDATDVLPAPAKTEIGTLLGEAVSGAPANELVEIRLLDPKMAGGKTIFSRCNPGDGSGLSEWTSNPSLARRQWTDSYKIPVQEALSFGLAPSQADVSPILSTLQSIALERFTGLDVQSLPKRLLVLSDLIEHGPRYSQYSGDIDYSQFKKSTIYSAVRTNLNGAEVTFYQVQRRTKNQISSADLIQFWMDWVQDNNGRFKEAVKLQGVD